VALAMGAAVLAACGNPQSRTTRAGGSPSPEIPRRLDVVCHDDGSTELANDQVQASSDGVHVQVDNRASEFVSLNGTALDFSKGVTEQVAPLEPGRLGIACWPGSMHTAKEPERIPIQVHDPDDYWTPPDLQCPNDEFIASEILDYASDGAGESGDPEDLARRDVKTLEPGDDVVTVGYPDATERKVAVRRDGEQVAVLSYSSASKGGWFLGGYEACDSAGIRV
jgi:hypothetical protein